MLEAHRFGASLRHPKTILGVQASTTSTPRILSHTVPAFYSEAGDIPLSEVAEPSMSVLNIEPPGRNSRLQEVLIEICKFILLSVSSDCQSDQVSRSR